MKKAARVVGINLIIFIVMNVLLIGTLALTYLIPQDSLIESISESYYTFVDEGLYQDGADGYTDLLILSSVFITPKNEESLLRMAVSNNVSRMGIEYFMPMEGMEKLLRESNDYAPYSNYFVGMTGFLKILLKFFNLSTVRFLFSSLTIVMVIIISVLLYDRTKDWRATAAFAALIVTGHIIGYSECLTFGMDIIMMLLGTIIVMILDSLKKDNLFVYFFLIMGMSTYFLNYWSFPLFSLIVPLTTFIILYKNKYNSKNLAFRVIGYEAAWSAGFLAEVSVRLIITNVLYAGGTLAEHLALYTSRDSVFDKGDGRLKTVAFMILRFLNARNLLFLIVLAMVLIIFEIIKIKKNQKAGNADSLAMMFTKEKMVAYGLLIEVAFIPLIWLGVFFNHTFHGFDNNLICVSVFAALSIFSVMNAEQ